MITWLCQCSLSNSLLFTICQTKLVINKVTCSLSFQKKESHRQFQTEIRRPISFNFDMFNELLRDAGEFGLYQKFLTFGFLMLTMIVVSFANWTQIFILFVSPHRCKMNWNDADYRSGNLSKDAQCRLPFGLNSSDVMADNASSCQFGYVYDFSKKFPSYATEQNLVCNDAWKMYMLHASYYGGAALGAIMAGVVADRYGRRRAYQICLMVNIAADIATFFAPNVTSFAVCRFFSSMGSTNITTVSFVLAMEYTGRKYRLVNLAVWSLTFTFSSTIIPWIAYGLFNWRYILGATFIPSTMALLLSSIIPESASWLMTKGRWEETAKLMHQVAKMNGKNLSMEYIQAKLEKQKKQDLIAKEQYNQVINHDSRIPSFLQPAVDLFRTRKMCKTTLILCLLWMISTMCYIGNNLETSNLPFPWYLAFSIGAISELPANIICLFTLDKLGRRWTNFFFLIVGGVLAISAGSFAKEKATIVVESILIRLCFAASFDISFTFTSESFPTIMRGRGILLVRAFGSIANSISPLIVYLSESDKLLPLVVLGGISLFGATITLLLPETARQHLPHTLEDAEKFGNDQKFCYCPFATIDSEKEKRGNSKELAVNNEGFQSEEL